MPLHATNILNHLFFSAQPFTVSYSWANLELKLKVFWKIWQTPLCLSYFPVYFLSKRGQCSPQLRAGPTLRCQSWPLTPRCYPADNASASFGTASLQHVGMAIYAQDYDEKRKELFSNQWSWYESVLTHMQYSGLTHASTKNKFDRLACVFSRGKECQHELPPAAVW